MELRRHTFMQLKAILEGAGLYEEDMGLDEMRQMAQAMELSSIDGVQRALLESEIDFQIMCSSTMIGPQPTSQSERDCDSPPTMPVRMTVRAIVHHEHNWNPWSPFRKRESTSSDCEISAKRVRLEEPNPDNSQRSDDLEVSCETFGSLSSIIEDSFEMPSIGEMPSLLLVSTSSAAISDVSGHKDRDSSDNEY